MVSRSRPETSDRPRQTQLAQLDVAVHDAGNQAGVDRLPVALLLDLLQDGVGHSLMEVPEQVVPPGDQGQLVNVVYALPALLALPPDPVPAERTRLHEITFINRNITNVTKFVSKSLTFSHLLFYKA